MIFCIFSTDRSVAVKKFWKLH